MTIALRPPIASLSGAERTGYMPFIDGVRAIAVVAVVAFHVNLPGVEAGFLGVDIFFVISGFLILGATLREIEDGSFSATRFLARRALRIFPLLALVIGATCVAMLAFPVVPSEVSGLTASAKAAALFAANVYFASDVGYFAAASESKPLLHIWSLAVEEQFYLVTALIAAALAFWARRPAAVAGFVGVALLLASAGAWVLAPAEGSDLAFYLLPWRAWEFLLGGFAAVAVQRGWRVPLAAWFGATLLIFGLYAFDSTTFMPGALFVAPGTAAILLAGARAPNAPLARLLALSPLRAIGLVSYGWYLWHWPILFYVRALNFGHAELTADLWAAAISLGLAAATYFLIEAPMKPLRAASRTWRGNVAAFAACAAALVAMGFTGAAARPLYEKINSTPVAAFNRANSNHDKSFVAEAKFERGSILSIGKGRVRAVGWGDSFSRALTGAMAELAKVEGIGARIFWSPRCLPIFNRDEFLPKEPFRSSCRLIRARFEEELPSLEPETGILMVANWRWPISQDDFEPLMRESLSTLSSRGHRILLVALVPRFEQPADACVYRATVMSVDLDRCGASRTAAVLGTVMEKLLRAAEGLPNIRIIDPAEVFCDADRCTPVADGRSVFGDAHHLNADGALRVYAHFADDFRWLAGD